MPISVFVRVRSFIAPDFLKTMYRSTMPLLFIRLVCNFRIFRLSVFFCFNFHYFFWFRGRLATFFGQFWAQVVTHRNNARHHSSPAGLCTERSCHSLWVTDGDQTQLLRRCIQNFWIARAHWLAFRQTAIFLPLPNHTEVLFTSMIANKLKRQNK